MTVYTDFYREVRFHEGWWSFSFGNSWDGGSCYARKSLEPEEGFGT